MTLTQMQRAIATRWAPPLPVAWPSLWVVDLAGRYHDYVGCGADVMCFARARLGR